MFTPEQIEAKLDKILLKVERPGRYVGGELNATLKDWNKAQTRVAFVFPDVYDIGVSNVGLKVLYDQVNQREDALAERAYSPWFDMEALMREHGIPLYALESKQPLACFDLIGFSLPYETLYTNALNILDLAGIPVRSAERDDSHPIIIAGGHSATNPEPMHAFIDAFVIGEGEEVIHEIIDVVQKWKGESKNPRKAKAKRGGFRFMRADDLAVDCLRQLWDRLPGLDKGMVDDLVVGCANPEGEQGLQIGRQIAIRAFGQSVPGMTVNRYCASGLETIAIATAKIRAGMGSVYVAGGVESMSSIPMEGYKLAVNYDVSVEHPDYVIGMGLTAEAVASKYKISREAQDEFAVRSHSKAESARSAGLFAKELGAVKVHEVYFKDGRRAERDFVVGEDEGIRADTSIEALSALKPVFAALR